MSGRCIWVSLPHATFGIITEDGRVTDAPPIARWAIGRAERDVAAYYRRKGAEFRNAIPRKAEGRPRMGAAWPAAGG